MNTQAAVEMSHVTLPFVAEQIARLSRIMVLSRPVRREFSAGGAVIRESQGKAQILMIKDRFGFLALPKGHIDPGETPEQAAIREVKEETGIDCKIIRSLCSQRYRFFDNDGIPVEKVVEYYLMHEVSGNLKPQLSEVAGVLWVDQEDLSIIRTYSSTMNMLKRFLTAHIQSDLP